MIKNKFGIALKLSVITTFLILLGFAIMGVVFYIDTHIQMEENLKTETDDILNFSTKVFSIPMQDGQKNQLNSLAESLLQERKKVIRGLRIRDKDLKIIGEYISPHEDIKVFDMVLTQTDYLYSKAQIEYEKEIIGEIEMITSPKALHSELLSRLKIGMAIMIVLSIVLSGLLYIYNYYFLKEPIFHLAKLPEHLKDHHILVSSDVYPWTSEFKIIADEFISATQEIKKRDEELKRYSENLEFLVDKRTKEVTDHKIKLIESSRLASLGEMSAGVAHEINNPLMIISGKAAVLLREVKNENSNHPWISHIEQIVKMSDRIAKIVTGLRTFAREGSNDKKVELKITEIVESVHDLCISRIKSRGIELKIKNDENIQTLFASEVQLVQVIVNLMNNSADAIKELPEKWIELSFSEDKNYSLIAVTDSGSGIPEDLQEKIMLPFFTTKEVGVGTGLGLSISSGIIAASGGQLYYDNKSERTRFVIKLPRE